MCFFKKKKKEAAEIKNNANSLEALSLVVTLILKKLFLSNNSFCNISAQNAKAVNLPNKGYICAQK